MQPSLPTRLRALRAKIHLTGIKQQIRNRGVRGMLPPIFVVLGIGLLLYVGVQYTSMYSEQRRLARQWEQQNQLQATSPTKPVSERAGRDGLTRLSIPKINFDAIVVEGTSRHSLLLGPGHLESSAFPGELGNSVITGHRDTFFRHIYELNKGDEILVRRDGKLFRYEVTGKRVVEPSDVSVTHSSSDARLTLITCYPTYYIGPAPERLVVFSKLAPEGGTDATYPLTPSLPENSASTHARE